MVVDGWLLMVVGCWFVDSELIRRSINSQQTTINPQHPTDNTQPS